MTDVGILNKTISDSGVTITFLAEKLGITREGLYKKLNGKTEFKASEIVKVQNVLKLTDEKRDEIFFAPEVE